MTDRGSTNYCTLCEEHAAKAEALRAKNAKLREALRVARMLAGPAAGRASWAYEYAEWIKTARPAHDPAIKWREELADALEALEA